MKLHPYSGPDDLALMKQLLIERLQRTPHSAYHPGDLDWRLHIVSAGCDPREIIRLWEDDRGKVIGWLFVYLRVGIFDVVIHPDLDGSKAEDTIFQEAEQHIAVFSASEGRTFKLFAFEDHTHRRALLQRLGYYGEACRVHFGMSLNDLPDPHLPDDFYFLDGHADHFAERRAEAHVDAFSPGSTMTAEKYTSAMRGASYDPTTDIVVAAPDGQYAAFALGWIDPASKIGMFEPVGTRQAYQRMGLGKAALLESMRRMSDCGIEIATVRTHLTMPGVIPFYESAGFRQMNTIYCYERSPQG